MAKIKHIKTPEEISYLAAFGKELNNLLKQVKLSQIEFGSINNNYKEFYDNLIEVISDTISLKITNFIKLIYNPVVTENKPEE